jgi:hypothetical protein
LSIAEIDGMIFPIAAPSGSEAEENRGFAQPEAKEQKFSFGFAVSH